MSRFPTFVRVYDLIAIGDTVTDAFIKLKVAAVNCDEHQENCRLCLPFPEKIPYEDAQVIAGVGNSANAAVSASRLGLKSALVANVGDDYHGQECLTALAAEKVGTEFIDVQKGAKTNYHYILWFGDDRTILIKHQRFTYCLPDIGQPSWIYLSSLGEHIDGYHQEIEKYLIAHPAVKLAFQPGTYQIKMGVEHLAGIYRHSEIFMCNKEEAEWILKKSAGAEIKNLLVMMHELGPKIVVITDGPKGAYASAEGKQWRMPSYPDPKPPYERTGAGDAFSSTFTVIYSLSLSKGLTIVQSVEEALRWAPINAMSVVQQVGARAGLLTTSEIEKYLAIAPIDYRPIFI